MKLIDTDLLIVHEGVVLVEARPGMDRINAVVQATAFSLVNKVSVILIFNLERIFINRSAVIDFVLESNGSRDY